MILHLLFDSQFSDYVIEQFSSENMFSDFVLISETNQMKYSKKLGLVPIVNPNVESEKNQLIIDIEKYNAVIFHGLFYLWQEWLLDRWPNKVKKAWVCWGGEIYGQHDIKSSFLKPLSKIVFNIHRLKKAKDRELQLIQALMNKQTEQTSDNTNNIKNEEVDNSETVDNNVDNVNGGEEDLMKLIEYVMSLPPEEQQALLQQYPELAQVMSLIEQETPTM